MNFCFTRTLDGTDMASLKERTTAALAREGFGVLTEIDLQATMKKKLDKDVEPHVILGACNPHFAYQVLGIDPHMSTMLPCNVTLRQLPDGRHEVAAIDPAAAMGAVGNPHMEPLAAKVREALNRVVETL
jgi:uncharacterized protein (DUF302 family)